MKKKYRSNIFGRLDRIQDAKKKDSQKLEKNQKDDTLEPLTDPREEDLDPEKLKKSGDSV